MEPFAIGRAPVTNGEFLEFVRAGGYERSSWWSADGWAWRASEGIERPGAWTAELDGEWRIDGVVALDPHAPVVHVSWYEADAFCRSQGLRLPTEPEWEAACCWTADGDRIEPDLDGANLDFVANGPIAPGAPVSASGCVGMIGDVWEWTSSWFAGYPGFSAHPYREYSEVFFGEHYRVLRGGSWATSPRVASGSFRNWDYPLRRQIFAGFRVAA